MMPHPIIEQEPTVTIPISKSGGADVKQEPSGTHGTNLNTFNVLLSLTQESTNANKAALLSWSKTTFPPLSQTFKNDMGTSFKPTGTVNTNNPLGNTSNVPTADEGGMVDTMEVGEGVSMDGGEQEKGNKKRDGSTSPAKVGMMNKTSHTRCKMGPSKQQQQNKMSDEDLFIKVDQDLRQIIEKDPFSGKSCNCLKILIDSTQ